MIPADSLPPSVAHKCPPASAIYCYVQDCMFQILVPDKNRPRNELRPRNAVGPIVSIASQCTCRGPGPSVRPKPRLASERAKASPRTPSGSLSCNSARSLTLPEIPRVPRARLKRRAVQHSQPCPLFVLISHTVQYMCPPGRTMGSPIFAIKCPGADCIPHYGTIVPPVGLRWACSVPICPGWGTMN
jgi:hypothetical protein